MGSCPPATSAWASRTLVCFNWGIVRQTCIDGDFRRVTKVKAKARTVGSTCRGFHKSRPLLRKNRRRSNPFVLSSGCQTDASAEAPVVQRGHGFDTAGFERLQTATGRLRADHRANSLPSPDHQWLLQTFVWQNYDLFPKFPELQRFLAFWVEKLEGPLHSVMVAHSRLIKPAELKAIDGEFKLH